jgi:transposase
MAAAALERSMNANVLRRWVVEAERAQSGVLTAPRVLPAPPSKDGFVPVSMPKATDEKPIKIEVRRGTLTVSVQWPGSAMHECALWLREVLK